MEYTHPVSRERVLPGRSFETKREALAWLAEAEVDLKRGDLLDPAGGRQTFESYARAWLDSRADLRPTTLELYDYLLRCHLLPSLGDVPMASFNVFRMTDEDLATVGNHSPEGRPHVNFEVHAPVMRGTYNTQRFTTRSNVHVYFAD